MGEGLTMLRGRNALLACCGLLVVAIGCSSVPAKYRRFPTDWQPGKREPNARYTVDPPDVIRVEFLNDPELNRDAVVRSDGFVVLPLVDEVHVAGLTTAEIRDLLDGLYAEFYKEPELLVSVVQYRSKQIFLYGEVVIQGPQAYTGYLTVIDAIGLARGLTPRAAWRKARIARGDPTDPEIFTVDLKALLLEGDMSQDVALSENDVLYVPPSWLARVGYAIETLLFPVTATRELVIGTSSLGTIGGAAGGP
jgi:polysaccharide export outer membrane protein